MGVLSKSKRDAYYYHAKIQGYRARSAFKLLDIESTFKIFEHAENIVDLCAAPGSWSQVLASSTNGKIIAIDVQEMAPITGVEILKEDITSQSCYNKIVKKFGNNNVDLIVCDGAPDVTGFHDLDEFLQLNLLKSALSISVAIGKTGSIFVGKCFRGPYTGYVLKHFMNFYEEVRIVKPRSSRTASVECFILGIGLKDSDKDPKSLDISEEPPNFALEECGDGPNPDFAFLPEDDNFGTVQKPINPPYQGAIEQRKNN
ncbi:tRNA (cytidine32/guanosine34-2'-O)-methyltransferase [Enteropsectra breve]|nr:tRNA (cytidine32/guanosine34-2'-O)-methyltransferase [Enteropsectra breve]